MEENDRLQKQVSQLVYENGYFRQHTQTVSFALGCYNNAFSPFPIFEFEISWKILIFHE